MSIYQIELSDVDCSELCFESNPGIINVDNPLPYVETTHFNNLFSGCYNLERVPANLFEKNNQISSLESSFYECEGLTNAPNIPSNVTDMNQTFFRCHTLSEAPVLPYGLKNMQFTFAETNLIVPPIIPSTVEDMNSTFAWCYNLIEAPEIPDGVTNMIGTFRLCRNLQRPPVIPDGVVDLYATFIGCESLEYLPEIPSSVTAMMYTFANTMFQEYPPIPDTVELIDGLYSGCSNMYVAPVLPSHILGLDETFSYCLSLKHLPEIPYGVVSLRYTFMNTPCEDTPVIPNSVNDMTGTFAECKFLIDVTNFPNCKPEMLILDETFAGCSSLSIIPRIPGCTISMNGTFAGCASLHGDIYIDSDCIESAYQCFDGCSDITIHVPAYSSTYECFYDELGGDFNEETNIRLVMVAPN